MKKFKNDKERIAFLEDYHNVENGWYLWKEIDDMQRRWWRLDIPGCALIVEEEYRTFNYPEKYKSWTVIRWYIIKDWSFGEKLFSDQQASKTLALQELKRLKRENKI